jgi:hypothetical protein
MKTFPDMSLREHIQKLLEVQRQYFPQLTETMLKFCNMEDIVWSEESEKVQKKKLMDVKEFEVFFEKLCVEGREWVNVAGDSWWGDTFIVSVEYSARTDFSVTAVLISGPSCDGTGRPLIKTNRRIIE